MQTSPSLEQRATNYASGNAAYRAIRFAVNNGVPSCPSAVAVLEARGIDVGELETRIRQNQEFHN